MGHTWGTQQPESRTMSTHRSTHAQHTCCELMKRNAHIRSCLSELRFVLLGTLVLGCLRSGLFIHLIYYEV